MTNNLKAPRETTEPQLGETWAAPSGEEYKVIEVVRPHIGTAPYIGLRHSDGTEGQLGIENMEGWKRIDPEAIQDVASNKPESWEGELTSRILDSIVSGLLIPSQSLTVRMARELLGNASVTDEAVTMQRDIVGEDGIRYLQTEMGDATEPVAYEIAKPTFQEWWKNQEGTTVYSSVEYVAKKSWEAAIAISTPSIPEERNGWQLIQAERQRQMDVEGWTPEHDDEHSRGEMMSAAQDYIAECKRVLRDHEPIHDSRGLPFGWPWAKEWWKPSPDPIRNLVKAGALLAAEIDRLQRIPAPLTSVDKDGI